jgi:rhodanese-related sulfurtransferase
MSTLEESTDHIEQHHLRVRVRSGQQVIIIEVRSAQEFAAGHIDGAINDPLQPLGFAS